MVNFIDDMMAAAKPPERKRTMLQSMLDQLREPRSYAALSGIAATVGLSDQEWGLLCNVIAAVSALVTFWLTKKPKG